MHLFEGVGVEFGLLLALLRVGGRPLGFDHGERLAVVAPEDVVGVSDALVVGHGGDFVFGVARLVEGPSGALEVHVDQVAARFGFGVVVGVGPGFAVGADVGDLFAQGLEFGVEFVVFALLFEGGGVLFGQSLFEGDEVVARDDAGGVDRLGHAFVLPCGALARGVGRVRAHEPVADVVEFLDDAHGVELADGARFVNGLVALSLDDAGFLVDGLGQQVLEGSLVEQGAEAVGVGPAEAVVVAVEPVDDGFEGKAGVEAGGARVADDVGFGKNCGGGDVGELGGDEGEVGTRNGELGTRNGELGTRDV